MFRWLGMWVKHLLLYAWKGCQKVWHFRIRQTHSENRLIRSGVWWRCPLILQLRRTSPRKAAYKCRKFQTALQNVGRRNWYGERNCLLLQRIKWLRGNQLREWSKLRWSWILRWRFGTRTDFYKQWRYLNRRRGQRYGCKWERWRQIVDEGMGACVDCFRDVCLRLWRSRYVLL